MDLRPLRWQCCGFANRCAPVPLASSDRQVLRQDLLDSVVLHRMAPPCRARGTYGGFQNQEGSQAFSSPTESYDDQGVSQGEQSL